MGDIGEGLLILPVIVECHPSSTSGCVLCSACSIGEVSLDNRTSYIECPGTQPASESVRCMYMCCDTMPAYCNILSMYCSRPAVYCNIPSLQMLQHFNSVLLHYTGVLQHQLALEIGI